MTTGAKPKLLTYEEYLNEPETMEKLEIIDGEVIMAAAPNRYHQITLGDLYTPVRSFVRERRLGEVLFAPVDVVVQQEPLRVRQPDLVFVSNERADILGDRINGGPDLVVEILSPSNRGTYTQSKLADYARINVLECWLVSWITRTVEVLRLESGEWQRAYIRGPGERIESAVLPGLNLDIADIFQGT